MGNKWNEKPVRVTKITTSSSSKAPYLKGEVQMVSKNNSSSSSK